MRVIARQVRVIEVASSTSSSGNKARQGEVKRRA